MQQKIILITGGTGYIGSHAVVAFEQAGYKTVMIDNLSNSSKNTLFGIKKILGYVPDFFEGDICDHEFLSAVFEKYSFDAVIHFAGLKGVGESCDIPFSYYHSNIEGSISLFEIMEKYSVRKIIFSSSATVYDVSNAPEYREEHSLGTSNPYGTTKQIIEQILDDLAIHKHWSVVSLRYFNPIGTHPSGYIGETPNSIPNNLLPYIMDVAIGKRDQVNIYGADYDTIDGTGVRDYIDVCDLVEAHICAYEQLDIGSISINIGTGQGTSVLEMIHIVENEIGKNIPYQVIKRRQGDIAEYYANVDKVFQMLGWKSKRTLPESLRNTWKYTQNMIDS